MYKVIYIIIFIILVALPKYVTNNKYNKLPYDDFELFYQDDKVTIYHHKSIKEHRYVSDKIINDLNYYYERLNKKRK